MSKASLRAAEAGEPRRAPEGPRHSQRGFGYFLRKESNSAAGPKPGNTEKQLDAVVYSVIDQRFFDWRKEDRFPINNVGNDRGEDEEKNNPDYHSSICPTSLRLYPPRASTSRRNG